MFESSEYTAETPANPQIYLPEWAMKVVIIGDPGVGKTTLRRTFNGKQFRETYLPTLGADFSVTKFNREDHRYVFTLWDLSGQKQFSNIHPQYYVGSHGAIVVVDVDTDDPIQQAIKWIDRYVQYAGKYNGPIMVLMNKIDLLSANDELENKQKFDTLIDQLKVYYHNKFSILGYMTSAKTAENVKSSFMGFLDNLVDHYQQPDLKVNLPPLRSEVPQAYFIGFDEFQGPVIISRYPQTSHDPSPAELSSSMRLSTTVTFDDLLSSSHQTGISTWSDPMGSIAYIGFLTERQDPRRSYDLYFMGVTIPLELKQQLIKQFSMVEGELHHAMNQVNEFLMSNRLDDGPLSVEHLIESDTEMYNYILTTYLEELSNKIYELLKE